MSAHTPGPWELREKWVFPAGSDDNIAHISESYLRNGETRDANARLIAAAPDGYQTACDVYLALLQLDGVWRIKNQEAYCKLRDYIAAASGRDVEEVQCDFEARAAAELWGPV
jgi:hypothetical protein